MTESIISGLFGGVTVLLTVLLTGWVLRGASAPPEASGDGTLTMRYPRSVCAFGVVCALIGIGVILAAAVWGHGESVPGMVLSIAVIQGLIGIPGGLILLSCRFTHAVLHPDGFTLHSWARREPAEVLWRDVERLTFSGLSGYLRFHLTDGRSVRLSVLLRGIPLLAPVLAQLDARGASQAVAQMTAYRAHYGA